MMHPNFSKTYKVQKSGVFDGDNENFNKTTCILIIILAVTIAIMVSVIMTYNSNKLLFFEINF